MPAPEPSQTAERLRLDKWLWYARILKSRTLAQKLVQSGQVRIDGTRTTRADFPLRAGMVLTMNVHDRLRVLKVLELGTRRGPAPEAQSLYQDLSPQLPRADGPGTTPQDRQGVALRTAGAGRPTKRDRRRIEKFTAPDGPHGDE